MKILNRSKNKSNGFKGTFLKIGVIVLIAFMCFGAMKSCVKVNAQVTSISNETMYTWNFDSSLVNGQFQSDFIGLLPDELDRIASYYDYSIIATIKSSSYWNSNSTLSYQGNTYANITVEQTVSNDGLSMVQSVYYYKGTTVTPFSEKLYLMQSHFERESLDGIWSSAPDDIWVLSGVSPFFVFLHNDLVLHVEINTSGNTWNDISSYYTLSDFFYPYITEVVSNSSYNLYDEGFKYGYNRALADFDSSSYYSSGYNAGYDVGYQVGLDDPHNPKLSQGYRDGYDDGYNDGLEDSPDNPYTFKNLFLSALEAPVTIISGALNWNFLGYNMKDFVFSMFTIAILAFILRKLI